MLYGRTTSLCRRSATRNIVKTTHKVRPQTNCVSHGRCMWLGWVTFDYFAAHGKSIDEVQILWEFQASEVS